MRGQHLGMDGLHRLHHGMREWPLHDSRRNSSAFFLIKRFAAAAAFSGVMTGRTGVNTMEPPSCRLMLTWSPTLRRARSIRAASNVRPCELPIFVIVLVMRLNYVLQAILSSPPAGGNVLIGWLGSRCDPARRAGRGGPPRIWALAAGG